MPKLEPIKPCPFCGMAVKIVEKPMYYNVSHADVNVLRDCEIGIRIYARTKQQAIRKWNRRAKDGEPDGERVHHQG